MAKHQNALQRGLHDGWQAFVGTAKVLLIIVGTLLPFAILVAILWWPVARLLRATAPLRKRTASAWTSSPATPTPAPVFNPTPTLKDTRTGELDQGANRGRAVLRAGHASRMPGPRRAARQPTISGYHTIR